LTGRARLETALTGGDCVAFAPLVWARLPEFVRSSVVPEFWLDIATTQRMLGDAASVCLADALAVPLLPRLGPAGAITAPSPDEIAELEEVAASAALLGRLRAIGEVGLVAEFPGLGELARMFPGASDLDLEDALNDLVRIGLEAGAQAAVVRVPVGEDLTRSLAAVAPVAGYYFASVLGVDGERASAFHDSCQVALLGHDGSWPELSRGVVLSAGDVTEWWTPDDMRAVLAGRGDAR